MFLHKETLQFIFRQPLDDPVRNPWAKSVSSVTFLFGSCTKITEVNLSVFVYVKISLQSSEQI